MAASVCTISTNPIDMMKSLTYCCLFLFLIGTAGCGSGFVPLRGTVTFSDDGSPLTTGSVYFDNGKALARGKINEDGTYVVGSLKNNDGLAPGHYRVYVQAIGPDPSGALEPMGPAGPGTDASDASAPRLRVAVSLVDAKFNSAETSGLELNVDRKTKTHDIVVDRNPHVKWGR